MGNSPSSTTSTLSGCLWRGPEAPCQSVAVKLVFEAGQAPQPWGAALHISATPVTAGGELGAHKDTVASQSVEWRCRLRT